MSVWDWINEYRTDAIGRGDQERLDMTFCMDDAFTFWETDPDRALEFVLQGRRLAQALAEPRWLLLFEHWRLQWLLYCKPDFRRVLDLAVQAALESRKPEFTDFPQRVCIQEDLIAAYLEIDPVGYEEKIQQALDYAQGQIAPDAECRHCVNTRRTTFLMDLGRHDEALQSGLKALEVAESDGSAHYVAVTYDHLCTLAHRAGRLDELKEYAELGEIAAGKATRQSLMSVFLLWQAFLECRNGDELLARRLHNRGVTRMNRLLKPPPPSYYDALCAYHEAGEDLHLALETRNQELDILKDKGQLALECQVRIKRCRVLQKLGQLSEDDVEGAGAAAKKLRRPDRYLNEISDIDKGANADS